MSISEIYVCLRVPMCAYVCLCVPTCKSTILGYSFVLCFAEQLGNLVSFFDSLNQLSYTVYSQAL